MKELGFDDLGLFARVAALGTLSAVARERDVPVSQVSRSLARIEKACGARLIHRSTHALTLTAEGRTFLAYCQRIGGTFEELEGEFATQAGEASGWVRVAASTVMAQYLLLPSLGGLSERHPRLHVELEVSDRLADLAQGRHRHRHPHHRPARHDGGTAPRHARPRALRRAVVPGARRHAGRPRGAARRTG